VSGLLGERLKYLSKFLLVFLVDRFASLVTFIVLIIVSLLLNKKNPQLLHRFYNIGSFGPFIPEITVLYFCMGVLLFLSFQFIFRNIFIFEDCSVLILLLWYQ